MKKIYPVLIIISAILVLISCEKVKTSSIPIQIITDKVTYSTFENIKVELINNSDSVARYFVCSSYKGIPPNIYKLENNSWNAYWGPICNGFSSYCCAELLGGASSKDTLHIELERGIYRIEYQFIVRPSHDYKSFFSNSIKVE
jgi:major membrane immunogen (membrane-anchored lipoprotein)